MKGLTNRVAVVTGGGSGIGEAICLRLAEEQVDLSIFDQNRSGAERVASACHALNVRTHVEVLDIADYGAVRAAVDRTEVALGEVAILINCAGWDKMVPFIQTDEVLHDKVIATNLKGPVNLMHVVAPRMAQRNFGRVVSISSDAGRVGSSGQAVYSACKAGVAALSKTLAREFARNGLTFNTVAPGPTSTPMMEAALAGGDGEAGSKILQKMAKAIPLRRIGVASDVAGIVVFLVSEEANFITGQIISVSGGLTMQG